MGEKYFLWYEKFQFIFASLDNGEALKYLKISFPENLEYLRVLITTLT